MIKLKPLEYFILNITTFLVGIIIFYNFPFKMLFLLICGIFIKPIRLLTCFLILGFIVMLARFESLKQAKWHNLQSVEVLGVVKKLYFKKGKQRALIQLKNKPEQLIASFKAKHSLKLQDEVMLKGMFISLPPKVYPTFYDIDLKSRFNSIVGYIKVYEYEAIKSHFSLLQVAREHTLKILDRFEKQNTKSIATAILLGDKGMIKQEDYNLFKKAGLAHILAISGLHMTIVCVLIFRVFFQMFAFTTICMHLHTKQIAGILGVFCGLFYLLLAGVPVSGLRSFIMVVLVFCSFFAISGASGVRSLAVAMFLILIFYPEEAFFPSFQLSFASVLCLLHSRNFNFKIKVLNYIFGIIYSSFLVSLVTLPFAIHHFNFVHFYGFASNVIAIPFLIFFIMPFAILSFLNFTPFIRAFEFGIDALIKIADFVANLPFSSIFMLYFNGYLLSIYTIALIFAFCFKNKLRFIGYACLFLTILTYFLTAKKPFLITNEEYTVFKDGNNYISLFFIPDGFLKEVWEEKLNTELVPINLANLTDVKCTDGVCYSFKPNFTIIYEDASFLEQCTGGVLVNTISNKKDFNCNFKTIITLKDLEKKGQEPFIF